MKSLSLLVILGLAGGVSPGSGAEVAVVRSPEVPFEDPRAFPDDAYPLLAKARVVWFGEIHGTNEAPALLLGMIRLIARHDKPPVVALEIPAPEQPAIDDYLIRGDDTVLRNGWFSHKPGDGRSSHAMVKLLEALRTEKIAALVCFDPRNTTSAQDRDEKMAAGLAESAAAHPDAKVVVLSGNVHSRVTEGTSWDEHFRPAAFVLSQKLGPVLSLNLRYEGGTAWTMNGEGAGVHAVSGSLWKGTAAHYISCDAVPKNGHRGVIFSRTVSASLPWGR